MMHVVLSAVGTKKMLWGVTGLSVFAIALTPELMVSFGALLAIVFTGVVNIMNARVAAKRAEQTAKITEETLTKAEVIAGQVDGMHTKSDAKIDAQEKELLALKQALAEEKQKAVLLAQATAVAQAHSTSAAPVGPPPPASGSKAETSLKQIDSNTAAIERNTAATDATVQDLKKEP